MFSPRQNSAALELVIACLLWGFGFVAAIWALRGGFEPNWTTSIRLGVAGGLSLVAIAAVPVWRRSLTFEQAKLAFIPGAWLCLTLILQTWGLKYTTATKSGFVTTLYVLIVPFLERWLMKRALPKGHWIAVAVAFVGAALICDFHGGTWNIGDALTLACAVAASFQIFWFGLIGKRIRDAFVFNSLQSLWAAPVPLIAALVFESVPSDRPPALAWAGLASLTFGSTLIAFMLQIRAQRTLRPSTASLIFLLESPFAAVFAMVLLDERLKPSQWAGAGLIVAAVLAATMMERPREAAA